MLLPVCIRRDGDKYSVLVPDMPGCVASDENRERALTRIHLKIEGELSERLLAGKPLPEVSGLDAVRAQREYASCEFSHIHINPAHLHAVARHQAGR